MKRFSILLLVFSTCFVLAAWPQAQLKVLHSFAGGSDGQYPRAGLVPDSLGNLYGTTEGIFGYYAGTVFQIGQTGVETVLYNFGTLTDGPQAPSAPLLIDSRGNIYGTTGSGGSAGFGTVFKLSASGRLSVLYSFLGGDDGANPTCALVDSSGNLYGTTVQGGGTGCNGFGCGTVFKISPDHNETILHAFAGSPDGANPESGLIMDVAGNLYGTTMIGGANNLGTVYKISPSGVEEVLYSFVGPPKGAYPEGSLIQDSAGNFYGTTGGGGTSTLCTNGCGTIFKLSASGKEFVAHSFSGLADGGLPSSNLVRDKRGNFYGTTTGGGEGGWGTVFELSPKAGFTTLYSFQGAADGGLPSAGVLDSLGNLYGTTFYGGTYNFGVVFELTP